MYLPAKIKTKLTIGVLAFALIIGSSAFAAQEDTSSKPQEQIIAATQPETQTGELNQALILFKNLNKEQSINEINQYLAKMKPEEVASVLRMLKVANLIQANYVGDVSTETLLTGAVKGTVDAIGDPYSVYMAPDSFKSFMISMKGSFSGVGIVLGAKNKVLTVIAPIDGTPADKAGIKAGDQIIKIDNKDATNMAIDEAVNLIRGPEGTEVTLTISRAGQEPKDYQIVRSIIKINSVGGKMLNDGIGYIRITNFNETTGADFDKKLVELEEQGLKAVILDLRNNPGGLLEESVKVLNNLVPRGPVVSVVTKDGSRDTFYSRLPAAKYPLVVLVNGGSASASEIVAGAVQDTGAGTLIGTKTFGKGSVQNLKVLDDASAVKLTIAKYYTPKGRSIHGIGIEPDIKVEMPETVEEGKDPQLDKAIEVIKEKLQSPASAKDAS